MKVRLKVVGAAAGVSLLLSACGDSTSDTSSGENTGSTGSTAAPASGALAEAAERVEAAKAEPTEVGVEEPLSRRPETGKRVTYLTCGVGVCQQIEEQLKVAVQPLGWQLSSVAAGTTPEEIVAAWDRALSSDPRPDAILTSGVPVSVYQEPLRRAAAAGIPVVDWASANPPKTPGIIFDINPVEDNEVRGELLADFVATETDGKAKTLSLNIPDYPTLVAQESAFKARMDELCPEDCTTETLNFAATDIGTKVPSAVVSALQSDPDINYIVPSFDDLGLGVAEALKAAGLDKRVAIASQSSNQVAASNIASGVVHVATIPQGVGQMAYKALDVLARHWNGDSLEADAKLLPVWIQTKETVGDPNDLWKGPKGYEEQFKKLWLIS